MTYHNKLDDREASLSTQMQENNNWFELSKYLIDPLSEFITNNESVLFIPHDRLHSLPLHALQINGEPLIENHPVKYDHE